MARTRARAQKKNSTEAKKRSRKPAALFYVFLAITAFYAAVTMLGPIDPAALAKYQLTEAKTRVLQLTVVIPFIIIWLVAYYGYSSFYRYSKLMEDTPEGPGLKGIARGLGFLAFSLPVNSLFAGVSNSLILTHESYRIPMTISRNYLSLILPLFAFVAMSNGGQKLVDLIKRKRQYINPYVWTFGTILVSTLFSWLLVARPADPRLAENIYLLPSWLIVTTLAVPYLYTWFRGVVAAYYIGVYDRNVKGALYKLSLRRLSLGILTVIGANIFIQLITTLSNRLYRLHLTPILILVYLLVAMYAFGFGWIASGAKKLKKIEEV